MNSFCTVLEGILDYLCELRRPVVHSLQAGADEKTMRALFEAEGLAVPHDVLELWSWRNGTLVLAGKTILDDIHFFPGFFFYSFEDALNQYRAMKGDDRWNARWLPVFANGGGDFYAVVCDGSGDAGSVIGFILGQSKHPVEYQSLEKMCETLLACYARGVFFVTPEGYLEMDDMAHSEIAMHLNPEVSFWKAG